MHMLSPAEVAERTGLSRSAVYRAIEDGELRASKLRGRIRVEQEELRAWTERSLVTPRSSLPAYEPPVQNSAGSRAGTFRSEVEAMRKSRAAA
jgi:excisionase family DNA binding protein